MMVKYRFSALIIAALIAIPAGYVQAQSSDSNLSVEESYLQEAVDLMIVRETSKQDGVNQKLTALAFIGSLIEQGSTNEEIRITLERLSLEGTNVQSREKGRLKNDYPEVRRQAAKYLGAFNSEEAKIALIKVCISDNEPLVLQEAIRSLGTIGKDTDGEVVSTIVWVANKFHNTISPDNLIALAAIDSLDKIAKNNKNVREEAFQLLINISEGPYSPAVREKARQTIMDIRNLIANSVKEKRGQSSGQPK
jgi:lipopolysaccharide export LptBFGC system permease protein LptF